MNNLGIGFQLKAVNGGGWKFSSDEDLCDSVPKDAALLKSDFYFTHCIFLMIIHSNNS